MHDISINQNTTRQGKTYIVIVICGFSKYEKAFQ